MEWKEAISLITAAGLSSWAAVDQLHDCAGKVRCCVAPSGPFMMMIVVLAAQQRLECRIKKLDLEFNKHSLPCGVKHEISNMGSSR